MSKVTVEMDDTLDELVESVEADVLQDFMDYLEENPELEDFDDYYQDRGCDVVHEIVDSATPIYNKEIDDLYYLHGNEFDEAYENAGIGDGTEDNHKAITIYCYLEERAFDRQREIQEKFEEIINEVYDVPPTTAEKIKMLKEEF